MDSEIYAAYLAIGLMAVGPIYFGSYWSLKTIKSPDAEGKPKEEEEEEEEEAGESLSIEDAYMFPVIGSCVLFGLYLVFRYVDPAWVNYLFTAYFAVLGVAAVTKLSYAIFRGTTSVKFPQYKLLLTKTSKELFVLKFTDAHLVMSVFSAALTVYYVWTKNWVASNIFGLAFATNAVQLLALDSFKTGAMLLSGLFFYDIFWVFGTEVMVTVAKGFDVPIKVVFPKQILALLLSSSDEKVQFTMLGLGDIVIPGIFVALCLRFDQHLAAKREPRLGKRKDFSAPYFRACMAFYILGLTTTIFVMHVFKAAQPALLYLSPACIISVFLIASLRGELSEVMAFSTEEDGNKVEDDKDTQKKGGGNKGGSSDQRDGSSENSNNKKEKAKTS